VSFSSFGRKQNPILFIIPSTFKSRLSCSLRNWKVDNKVVEERHTKLNDAVVNLGHQRLNFGEESRFTYSCTPRSLITPPLLQKSVSLLPCNPNGWYFQDPCKKYRLWRSDTDKYTSYYLYHITVPASRINQIHPKTNQAQQRQLEHKFDISIQRWCLKMGMNVPKLWMTYWESEIDHLVPHLQLN
jgi:hypothetical protein